MQYGFEGEAFLVGSDGTFSLSLSLSELMCWRRLVVDARMRLCG